MKKLNQMKKLMQNLKKEEPTKETKQEVEVSKEVEETKAENLIEPIILANSNSERLHEIEPTGRKVKVGKAKKTKKA